MQRFLPLSGFSKETYNFFPNCFYPPNILHNCFSLRFNFLGVTNNDMKRFSNNTQSISRIEPCVRDASTVIYRTQRRIKSQQDPHELVEVHIIVHSPLNTWTHIVPSVLIFYLFFVHARATDERTWV